MSVLEQRQSGVLLVRAMRPWVGQRRTRGWQQVARSTATQHDKEDYKKKHLVKGLDHF